MLRAVSTRLILAYPVES